MLLEPWLLKKAHFLKTHKRREQMDIFKNFFEYHVIKAIAVFYPLIGERNISSFKDISENIQIYQSNNDTTKQEHQYQCLLMISKTFKDSLISFEQF